MPLRLARPFRGVNNLNAAAAAIELDVSVDQCVEREVRALANPLTGVEAIANLADENVSGAHGFSADALHAATLRVRVTSVSAGALSFFVCHEITSLRTKPSARRSGKRRQNVLLAMGLRYRNQLAWRKYRFENPDAVAPKRLAAPPSF